MSSLQLHRLRPQPQPQLRRALAWVVLAAQCAALLHVSLSRHEVCEHGQLVEAGSVPHADLARDPLSAASLETAPSDVEQLEGEHGHCAVLGVLRTPAIASAAAAANVLADPVLASPASLTRSVSARPPLSVAPKQSPPV